NGVTDPELDVSDNLIVSAAGGVHFAPDVAEPFDQSLFDVSVNVFEADRKCECAGFDLRSDGIEGGGDLIGFGGREQADLRQHFRMSLTGANVVPVESLVK